VPVILREGEPLQQEKRFASLRSSSARHDIRDAFAPGRDRFHGVAPGSPGRGGIARRCKARPHPRTGACPRPPGRGSSKAELDGLPVPALDALVRKFIESHLDPFIQRAVVKAEAGMRAEVVRLISGPQLGVMEDEIDSPDISEDWAWTR
jgi:hypothetical protein